MGSEIQTLRLGDQDVSVFRSDVEDAYFGFRKPDGGIYLIVPHNMPQSDISSFVRYRGNTALSLGRAVHEYYVEPHEKNTIETGRIMYLLGKPYVVCTGDSLFKNTFRGEGSVYVLDDISTLVLQTIHQGDQLTYRKTYFSWADRMFRAQARKVILDCMVRAGILNPQVPEIVVGDVGSGWAHLNRTMDTLTVSRVLEGYPAVCTEYVYVNALVEKAVPDGDDGQTKEASMERAHVPWEYAEGLLQDPLSDYANGLRKRQRHHRRVTSMGGTLPSNINGSL